MKLTASTAALAVLMTLVSSFSSGQSRSRPQTIERLVILPNRNERPPAFLAGAVVSEAGEPLAGATISLTPHFANAVLALLAEETPTPAIVPALTDENGRFQFPALVAGDYDLAIELKGYLPLKTGQSAESPPLMLVSGQRIDHFKVALIRSAQIDGRIQSGDQLPAGIPVHLMKTDAMDIAVAQTITAADARITLKAFHRAASSLSPAHRSR